MFIRRTFSDVAEAEIALDKDGFRRCNGECNNHWVRYDVAWIVHANICTDKTQVAVRFVFEATCV